MLYTKDGYPEINEIVYCTVKKIYGNTTFVYLNEYEKEGVLTISEIAPGRIRNLRDHVIENKVIICKVLRVDSKQNRIDVSLRRVPIPVMKDKLDEIKKEEFSEKIYMDVGKELNETKDSLFEKTYEEIFENYNTVFEALYEIMLDNKKISVLSKLSDKEKETFIKVINDRIKPEEVVLKKKFHLSSTKPDGVGLVKNAIKCSTSPLKYDKINIYYVAAGEYAVTITHEDIKSADKMFNSLKNNLILESKKQDLDLKI